MTIGLLTVFGAGVLTLATPCVLPMVPVYFALVAGAGAASATRERRRALLVGTALFVAGFVAVFTLLGMAASTMGGVLQAHRRELLVVGGVVVIALGLGQLGVLRFRWLERTLSLPAVKTRFWSLNALLLGVVFALGWTPCVGPILGSVLTFTATSTSNSAEGALYLFTYALGVGLPLLGLAWVGDRALSTLKRLNRHLPALERATGTLMVVGGLVMAVPAALSLTRGDHAAADPKTVLAALHPELGDQPMLLAFHAQGCPACARMAPRVEELRHDCVGKRIGVLALDVAEPAGAGLARVYGVAGVPTVLLLDANRTAEGMLIGEHSQSDLRAAAASLVKGICGSEEPHIPAEQPLRAACGTASPSSTLPPRSTCPG
jgi:cytochrome c-type biogenesis protein